MKKNLGLILITALLAIILCACASDNSSGDTYTSMSTESSNLITSSVSDSKDKTDTANISTAFTSYDGGIIDTSDLFTDRDLRQTVDTSDAQSTEIKNKSAITIDKEGIYVISGDADDAQIIVDAADDAKIQIVLNGVNITNSSIPAIYVKNADKVFVTTQNGTENTLSVTGSFSADGTTNTDAVIFSKDDLVINGQGTLNISSTDNGISSKDDLKITGGTINITSSADAIEANDSIAIADGNISINTEKDGLHSENEDDNSKGYIYIAGGTFSITSGSDGIQATTVLQIDGGNIDISSSEGLEGTYIQINDGTVKISASDDGINASRKSSSYNVTIEINGGNISVDMGQGDTDALDTNGDLIINGGNISITAQSPFDYDGKGELNGGTVTVNGEQVTELTNQMMGGGMGGPMGEGQINNHIGGGRMGGMNGGNGMF